MRFTLLLSMLLCFSGAKMQAQASTDQEIVLTETSENRDIIEEDFEEGIKTMPRSVTFQPVYAYLSDKTIVANFVKNFSSVSVTIINETTGEVAYAETYANPTMCNIDLSGVAAGCYLIMIEADNLCLEGNFSL